MSILSFLRKKTHNSPSISDTALDYRKLPVMTANELIQFTGQQNRILSIKRIIKLDNKRFQILYLDVIYRFAELVQLMPASQAHHHAVPGGLLIHTLEVIEYAMSMRQQYKLPAFAEPEIQERERHAWTYAIFAAAILHDVGKRVTMVNFVAGGEIFSAFENKYLSETNHKNYQIIFNPTKYHTLHDKIGLTFSDLFPEVGRKFIFTHLNIVKEMSAYIHGDKHNAGMIGEIISQADQKSTGESLAHSPTRKFKGASVENIGERLMTQLRLMIASNDFVINKPNANIYTTENGFTYCVSKVIVDGVREHLQKQNETDIPTDNNRIFDIFQEYGFAETNHYTGKSIHFIQIFHQGNSRVFSVLKFKTTKLFQVQPTAFEGKIEEIKDRESARLQTPPTETATATPPTQPVATQTQQSSTVTDTPFPPSATETISETATTSSSQQTATVPHSENSNLENEILNDMLGETDITPSATANNCAQTGADIIGKTPPEPMAKPQMPAAVKTTNHNTEPDLAIAFLIWCRSKIMDKSIVINESNGPIQKVSLSGTSVIAVVTPRIFSEYAKSIGMPNPTDKSTFTKIQSAIHKAKLNIPAPRGQIHIFKIKKSLNNPLNGNIKLRHYLFSIDAFCGNDAAVKEIILRLEHNTNLIKS